jgi:ABC-type bacteriocin/lantibiotic exporter with double-glycine peptidase domain
MNPNVQKKKILTILDCIKEAPFSGTLIIANLVSSFLSVIGIPLLIFAYQYSQTEKKDQLPYYEKLKNLFELFHVDINFYSLLILSLILIIFGQTCLGAIELANRYVNIKVIKKNSIDLINYFKDANWIKILEDKSGKFQHAMSTESISSAQVVLDSLRLASASIQILFYIITSFYFSFKITGILLIFFIIMGFITIIVTSKINLLANLFNLGRIKIAEAVSNICNNKKYIKSTSIPFFFENVYLKIREAWEFDWRLHLYSYFLKYVLFIFTAFVFSALLIFYNKLNTSFEEVTIAILIFLRTTPVFIKLAESYSSINEQIPAHLNFQKRLNEFKHNKEKKGKIKYIKNSTIIFNQVSYKYPNTKNNIISNLNLKIEPKKSYAFIGESGSGKTTIVDMIVGLLKPTDGSIYYSKINQKDLNIVSFRNEISYISQNISLFDGTIKDNILMGKEKSSKEIIQASKDSLAYDFIKKMPKKFNTKLGENALKVSGGQKQRILLTRALLSNSSIIILDEATNQLDYNTTKIIKNSIRKLKQTKTLIIISHDKNVDKIVDVSIRIKKKPSKQN